MEDPIKQPVKILHFNDCYSISERNSEICGGCPRFVSLLRSYQGPKMTLFSGDLWSPSKHTSMFKGEQLIDPMNACDIDCACLGNHDFDLGLERLQFLNSKTNFPWLLSNLTTITGSRFASSLEFHVVEKFGYKFGLMGLIEYDWITTLSCLDVEDLIYEDFVACGNRLAKQLREDYSCDIIIALTHMRLPNDRRLALLVPEIDLILGGHDHLFAFENHEGRLVVKSGTDFMSISEINLVPWDGQPLELQVDPVDDDNAISNYSYKYIVNDKFLVEVIKRDVHRQIIPDEQMVEHMKKYESKMIEQMKAPLFYCDTPLETKFAILRTQEVAVGNLIADLMRKDVSADCALYNSGSIRSDFSYTQRLYMVGDLETIHPYQEKVYLVEVTHEKVWLALENSVSKLPALEGRFCQVSHMTVEYDTSKPPGQRVNKATLMINSEPYEADRLVKLAIVDYMWYGKDGFECLKDTHLLQASENVRTMSEILYDFFMMMKNHEYVNEYRLYQIHEKELTVNFIRLKIQSKVNISNEMFRQAIQFAKAEDKMIKRGVSYEEAKVEELDNVLKVPLVDSLSPTSRDEEELPSPPQLGRGISRKADSNEAPLPMLKLLTRFNIDLLLKRKAVLSLDCLIRLRKYQLITNLEKGPNKEILPLISPKCQNRLVEKPF